MGSLSSDESRKRGFFIMKGIRYVFTLMSFFGFFCCYCLRVNINVAIVAMVNASAAYANHSTSDECPEGKLMNNSDPSPSKEGEFNWSSNVQAAVLGSFYYGYCVSQIPGGRLAEVFSAKWVFGIGTLITSLMSLLTPVAAKFHVAVLISIRVVEGLAQGVTLPAMHSMLGKWMPDSERGLLSTIVYCGISVGTVVAMTLTGVLCDSTIFDGWPSAFYVFGLLGCLWFLIWCVVVSDSPAEHPCITSDELRYIVENQNIQHLNNPVAVPWKAILTSMPFWAIIITQTGQDYCFYTIINDLPTFLATVLHFEIVKNGFLSSSPNILQGIVGCMTGSFVDTGVKRKWFSLGFIRKTTNTLSCVGTALGLLGVCLAGCDVTITIVCYFLAMTIGGLSYGGYMFAHLDLSPEYAGTLMGISNTVSNLTGFIAPAVVGTLTEHSQTLSQWRIVFYINIFILLATSLVFLAFGSSKKQYWASSESFHLLTSENPEIYVSGNERHTQ